MELLIDEKKKTLLQTVIAHNMKSVCIILAISRSLLFVGIVVGGGYALVNALLPNFSMITVKGVAQKDVGWIIISTSFIVAPCLIFSVCLKALANNIASSNNRARVDESLMIVDNKLCYSFRIKHQTTSSERRVITFDFSNIKLVNYDEMTECLEFNGNIKSEYFDNYRNKKAIDVVNLDKFVIYDYFLPCLKDILYTKGVKVNN